MCAGRAGRGRQAGMRGARRRGAQAAWALGGTGVGSWGAGAHGSRRGERAWARGRARASVGRAGGCADDRQ